jgi:hypothetical protein
MDWSWLDGRASDQLDGVGPGQAGEGCGRDEQGTATIVANWRRRSWARRMRLSLWVLAGAGVPV